MAKETYRNVRKNRFTQISNSMLWDKQLSLEGKGFLSILLSNSDDWKLNMKEIIKRSKNGRDKHYAVVKELIKHGYFARIEIRVGGKFKELIYIFSDDKTDVTEEIERYQSVDGAIINPDGSKKSPVPENPETVEECPPLPENPDTVDPKTENPDTAEPDTENQDINNTKGNNTNSNNTNENNTTLNKIKESVSQSISDMYEEKSVPIPILKIMDKNIDRLTDDNIHPLTIKIFYETFSEHQLGDSDFAYVLEKVLTQTKEKIGSFQAVMKRAAKNFFDEYES